MKLTKEQISQIADLTDKNEYDSARMLIIEAMKDEENHHEFLVDYYKCISDQLNKWFSSLSFSHFRNETDKTLKIRIFKRVSNADEVWQALTYGKPSITQTTENQK